MFEALLIAENSINDFVLVIANFVGAQTEFGHYSINGMDERVDFVPPFTTNPLVTIRLDLALDPNDDQVDYEFELSYFGATFVDGQESGRVNVIIHEIGKLLYYMANCSMVNT